VLFSVAFLAKPDSMMVPLSVSTRMLDASMSLMSTKIQATTYRLGSVLTVRWRTDKAYGSLDATK